MRFKNLITIQSLVNNFENSIDATHGSLDIELAHFGEPSSSIDKSFAFINKPKLIKVIEDSQVVCALAPIQLKDQVLSNSTTKTWIFSKNPELLAREIKKLYVFDTPFKAKRKGIHPTAVISESATLASDVTVGPFAVIEDGTTIGSGSFIGAHAVIEENVTIKENTTIHPHAYIGHSCEIGNNCEVMPQAVIGSEGFGYAHDHLGNHYRVPHTGRVILEDDVHIGAATAIDRGTISDSHIGRGTKIDNQVHLAHNTVFGKNGLITAQAVTAGSSTIGDNFVCGGKTAITGHITITDNVSVAGLSGITKSVDKPGQYGGYPLLPLKDHLKVTATTTHIVELRKQVAQLMKKVFY